MAARLTAGFRAFEAPVGLLPLVGLYALAFEAWPVHPWFNQAWVSLQTMKPVQAGCSVGLDDFKVVQAAWPLRHLALLGLCAMPLPSL